MSSENLSTSAVTTPSLPTTPNIDGADVHQKKQLQQQQQQQQQQGSCTISSASSTPTGTSSKPSLTSNMSNPKLTASTNGNASISTSSSTEELNWSSLNSKMKGFNPLDAKRGSILIEHLSEYNKMASSQVILGEENEDEHSSASEREVSPSPTPSTPTNNKPPLANRTNTSSPVNTGSTTTTTTTSSVSSSATHHSSNLEHVVLFGINLFNDKPKKGVEYFIQHKLLEKNPIHVAEFLHCCPLLNKKVIGDYLGDMDPFSIQALEALIARFQFKDLDFDMALRQLLYCFRLPGEAQKIDRIMQKFANQFYKDNIHSGIFADPDAVYMLAFAIILLNTDVHNPKIKNKMPKSKFAKSLHGINGGKDLPIEYIEDIYDRIISDEIKMEPTAALFPYACKKGWLNIRVKGRVTDKWSRKWCILSDGTLYFFRKPTDTTPVRYLHPDTVITPKKEMKGRKNCFILNHCSPPISLQSLVSVKDSQNPQKSSFNPQAIFQQLAAFGKEKKKDPKFWDSISEKYDQKIDVNLFSDSFDTDSIGSFDTLSESSNYYDEDITSTSSSVNSTSPIHSAMGADKKKIAFSLRLGNKKTKDQLAEYETEFELQFNGSSGSGSSSNSSSENTTPTSTTPVTNGKPPVPSRSHLPVQLNLNNNNSTTTTPNSNTNNSANISLTQPRPNGIYKQGSTSLIRSSSISTFSTPTISVSAASSKDGNGSGSSTPTTPSTPSKSDKSSSAASSDKSPSNSEPSKKTIEDIIKQQEKLIKSSKQQTTVIINADTKREMDSWISLILSQFSNKLK